jgi:peptidyl-prolyl cis-trans isomerase D
MFEMMRRVFGPVAVTVIIGAIALVFIFYGVFNPKGSTRGTGSDSLAASVNGEPVSMQEFQRGYQQRIEMYQNMMKGKDIDPALLARLGIKQQVLQELIGRKLVLQEANRMGFRVSDDEVRDKIRELPYFQKDGKFDASYYEQVLSANRLSPSTFEDSMREDLIRGQFFGFMKSRARVSETEVQNEFLASENRRTVEYVAIGHEAARKMVAVTDKEVSDLLANKDELEKVKKYYEQNKFLYEKKSAASKPAAKDIKKAAETKIEYLPFEEVKRKVALEVAKDRRSAEVEKLARETADQILAKAKSSPNELKAFVKQKGLEIKTSDKFNRMSNFVPGVGEQADLVSDAFKEGSPLASGPKLYESHGSNIIVLGMKSYKPDMAEFPKNKTKLQTESASRKEQALIEAWMSEARAKAKIVQNDTLMKGAEAPEEN